MNSTHRTSLFVPKPMSVVANEKIDGKNKMTKREKVEDKKSKKNKGFR